MLPPGFRFPPTAIPTRHNLLPTKPALPYLTIENLFHERGVFRPLQAFILQEPKRSVLLTICLNAVRLLQLSDALEGLASIAGNLVDLHIPILPIHILHSSVAYTHDSL